VEDSPESNAASILHALANALNGISILVQLQQRYLTENPERMRQLITDTTRDLKDELDALQHLVEHLHQVLKESANEPGD
jgi:hypothetical protein